MIFLITSCQKNISIDDTFTMFISNRLFYMEINLH